MQRQPDFQAKSAERAVVGGDFTVVLADSGADNREPQPGTTGFAVAGFIRAVERPEDMFAIFRADTRAVVIDHNADTFGVGTECDLNMLV